jgi:hypothetical protein
VAPTKRERVAALLLTLLPTLFGQALFPSARITFLAPLLAWLYYRLPMQGALWASFGAGLLLDLLSSDYRLGIFALTYTSTTLLLYTQKRHFYAQRWSTLPILTWLFSLVATLIQVTLLAIVDEGLRITWRWAISDLMVYPLLDGLWAFIGFTLPLKLIQWRRPVRRTYRLKRPK